MHVMQSAHLGDHTSGLTGRAVTAASTYGLALLALAAALLFRHALGPWLGPALPLITVFGAVAAAACLGGVGPAMFVSVVGYVSSGWIAVQGQFIPVGAAELGGWPGLIAYLLTCVVITGVAEVARRRHAADGEAAAMFRAALRNVGEGVVTADLHGKVTSMNPAAELLTGWREADALGQPLDAVVRLIDASTRAPLGSPAAAGLHEDCVMVGLAHRALLVSRQGVERDVDDHTTPVHDAHRARIGIVMVLTDTSDARTSGPRSPRM